MYTINTLPSAGTGSALVIGTSAAWYTGLWVPYVLALALIAVVILGIVTFRKVKGV